ncbi:hypothetical protein EDD36DRAFT_71447 [Exophiala viscosa]|uniref:Uncharacterized protein n=1 Tax=Exophiala viscosa TaxID=2486360 RepID=A0AAN6DNV5_9EURO|nr:hypothetical protein EDD36DRAFT_71447 [Exophiala viscosa]
MSDSDSSAKVWVPVTVVGCILAFLLVFCCLWSERDDIIRVPPDDLLTRRRGQPEIRVRRPSRHLPRGLPWEEIVMASERPVRAPERPEPVFLWRDPRRGRSPPRGFELPRHMGFGPGHAVDDAWMGGRGGRFHGDRRDRFGGANIIEREPLFR